jgi:hypothetical protein
VILGGLCVAARAIWPNNFIFIERLWRSLKHEDTYIKAYASVCWERVICPPFVARELSATFAACSGGCGCVGHECYGRRM